MSTLSQRLRALQAKFIDAGTYHTDAEFGECIALVEALEATPVSEPVAWMKRDTTSDLLPESALDLAMEPDAASYIRKTWRPLYDHPAPVAPAKSPTVDQAMDIVAMAEDLTAHLAKMQLPTDPHGWKTIVRIALIGRLTTLFNPNP